MKNENENKDANGKVVSLHQFRQKKELAKELGNGRKPLYLDQKSGTIKTQDDQDENTNFGERLQRIRNSLDRINSLMTELKSLSQNEK